MTKSNRFDSMSLNEAYHIGDLDSERTKPYISYEGDGLSVSLCPNDWATIMGHGGSLYRLSHTADGGRFYKSSVTQDGPRSRELEWAIKNDYIKRTNGFRVEWEENQETHYMLFFNRESATAEALENNAEIKETTIPNLDTNGREYWSEAFRQEPDDASPLVIRDLATVWFAESHSFCGVWWDEEHNVSKYSAPRGVIFQSSLSDWCHKQVGEV